MHWEKIGRIFNPSDYTRHEKLYTHASNPTVVKLQDDLIRIFYSGRDKKNKSSVGAFDFNMKTLNIEKVFFNPFAQPTKNTFFLKDGTSHKILYENGVQIKHPNTGDIEGATEDKPNANFKKMIIETYEMNKTKFTNDIIWTLPDEVMKKIEEINSKKKD